MFGSFIFEHVSVRLVAQLPPAAQITLAVPPPSLVPAKVVASLPGVVAQTATHAVADPSLCFHPAGSVKWAFCPDVIVAPSGFTTTTRLTALLPAMV